MRVHVHIANPVSETDNVEAIVGDHDPVILAPGQSKLFEVDDAVHVELSVSGAAPSEPVEQPQGPAAVEAEEEEEEEGDEA